jgi:hypothetical protein
MARIDVDDMNTNQTDEDLDVYRDVDLQAEGLLTDGTFEAVLLWGTEHENTDRDTGAKTGTVRWGLFLGLTIPGDPPVKGNWWGNVNEENPQAWKQMLKVLDPKLFEEGGQKEVLPQHYVGRKLRVRLGYGKREGYEDRLFLQRILTSKEEQTFEPKRESTQTEVSDDDLPF